MDFVQHTGYDGFINSNGQMEENSQVCSGLFSYADFIFSVAIRDRFSGFRRC